MFDLTKERGKPGVPGGAAPLGWKPAFPTLRFLNSFDCSTLKAIYSVITISTLISSR